MMLQTLVENAIKHGLEPKPDGGRIEITADVADGQLAVHVRDTGMGFVPKSESGVGLANIRERLAALYGGRPSSIISVPPTGGTWATIKVPYEIATARPEPAPASEIRPTSPDMPPAPGQTRPRPPSSPTTSA
jgi:sensor histidine kinase YesM